LAQELGIVRVGQWKLEAEKYKDGKAYGKDAAVDFERVGYQLSGGDCVRHRVYLAIYREVSAIYSVHVHVHVHVQVHVHVHTDCIDSDVGHDDWFSLFFMTSLIDGWIILPD